MSRVKIQSVSLASLVHLWTGVCATDMPDKPGAAAHAREATRIMQYPYGCPPLGTLPSSQAGHCWGGQKTGCMVSRCSPVSLGAGNRRLTGGLQASPETFLLGSSTGNCFGPHPISTGGRDVPWDLAVLNLHGVQHHQGLLEIPEDRRAVRGGLVT